MLEKPGNVATLNIQQLTSHCTALAETMRALESCEQLAPPASRIQEQLTSLPQPLKMSRRGTSQVVLTFVAHLQTMFRGERNGINP